MALHRDMYRKRFARQLSEAEDEPLCRLIWAIDALQSSDRVEIGAAAIVYPAAAKTAQWDSPYRRFPWSLETIFNESLARPKKQMREGVNRRMDWRKFDGLTGIYATLQQLENAEYARSSRPDGIFDELARIGHRQFPWQRDGLYNIKNFSRSMYMFGGPKAAEYFEKAHGLSLADFVLAGWGIWLALQSDEAITAPLHAAELGLTREKYQAAVARLSMPLEEMRSLAAAERSRFPVGVAYRPSVLRRYPCISFEKGKRIRAPLIKLVTARVSSGLYYDLVDDGSARNEFQNRFADYSRELLALTFPEIECRPEVRYGPKARTNDTPDILMGPVGACRLAIECKANKMRAAALFGDDAMAAARDGFEYIAKGVEQLWRYFSHVRRGLISGHGLAEDAFGVVLTLDPWLRISRGRYEALMTIAGRLADSRGGVEPVDRKLVAFASIDDFEELLETASLESFLATLRDVANPTNAGYFLWSRHAQYAPDPPVKRDYPLEHRIGEFLPWWDKLDEFAISSS